MPEAPRQAAAQVVGTSLPSGVTMPIPVTTTRELIGEPSLRLDQTLPFTPLRAWLPWSAALAPPVVFAQCGPARRWWSVRLEETPGCSTSVYGMGWSWAGLRGRILPARGGRAQ